MKSNFIVLGVLALVIISMIALNTFPFGLRKAEAFQMKKKEGFQPTVADVKAARAAMGANSKKEGFQDVVAANPLPPRSNTPQANANPHLITLTFTQHGPTQRGFATDDLNELSAVDQLHAAPIRPEKDLLLLVVGID